MMVFGKLPTLLQKQQLIDLDETVKSVSNDPSIGDLKIGDLQGIRVFNLNQRNN